MIRFMTQHKIMTLIIVIVLIGAAWYGFTSPSKAAPVLTTTSTNSGSTSPDDQALVSTLLQLQAVSLSGVIFSDPSFLSLQDFTTQIVSEPIGRSNPFAPLSGKTVAATTSTANANPHLFAPVKH